MLMLLILSSIIGTTSAQARTPSFRSSKCNDTNSYISGSSFEVNLNDTLFTDLLPKASSVLFSNSTRGSGEDRVNALFYCRGDVDVSTCFDCVDAATRKIKDVCKSWKEGVVWYDECTLRYASRTILSIDEVTPYYPYNNYSGIVNEVRLDPYNITFDDTMEAVVQQAVYGKGLLLPGFATKEFNISSNGIVRCLAQCSPDIVGPGCDRCLTAALRLRGTWANTIMFLPSCFLRYDLYEPGTPPSPYSPSSPPPTRRGSHIALIAGLSAAFVVLVVIVCAWLWIKRPHLQGNILTPRVIDTPTVQPITRVDVEHRVQGLRKYTYSQVKKMTDNFSVQSGKGGYGVVYRGTLLNDSTTEVAVKVLNQNNAVEQFSNEMNVLAKISHRNIVSLLGYCQEETRLALIYEYMDRGNLRSLLSGNPSSLSWTDRLKIAVDTAEGLDYLHYHSNDLVVHRDVKPANILLNRDLRAKLADFGSSKIFPKDVTTVVTQIVSSPGYTDPGYLQTGLLNMRSDVYSFGIVLVELITGNAPTSESSYVRLFLNALNEGDLDKILDPNITRDDMEDGSVWAAIELACECVKTDETVQTERPDMSEVVVTLKKCLDMELKRNTEGNSARGSTSTVIMNAMNSDSISMVPDAR